MTQHERRVEALVQAYERGRSFPTVAKVRSFLGGPAKLTIAEAYAADLEARNSINANPGTATVIPAAKVPVKGEWERRSDGNADSDLLKCLAFAQEIVTKAMNNTHQMRKVSDKHPTDIDLMELSRDAAVLGQVATALQTKIDRVRASRS